MILAVFGASGRTGQAVAAAALRRGHRVRALCRPGVEAPVADARLDVVRGALLSREPVECTITGSDAVLCLFGPRPPYTDIFCAGATEGIVAAMRRAGVPRLLCLTGAMIGDWPANRSFLFGLLAAFFRSRLPALAADRRGQEEIVRASGLEWTLVKPPRLTAGRAVGRVRVGPALRVGLMSRISRADLSELMLDELEGRRFVRETVFVIG